MSLILQSFTASAQPGGGTPITVNHANENDLVLADNVSNVTHTGADYWESVDGERLRVACWDGTTPGIGWVFTDATGNTLQGDIPLDLVPNGARNWFIDHPGGVNSATQLADDPDIVVWQKRVPKPTHLHGHSWFVTVTFLQEINGVPTALYSIYSFNPQAKTLKRVFDPYNLSVQYPQLVSELNMPCATPNVDQGQYGNAVFVFESKGTVYARARILFPSGDVRPTEPAQPLHQVTPVNPRPCWGSDETEHQFTHPDVSVWESTDPASTTSMVHYTYILTTKPDPAVIISDQVLQRVLVQSEYIGTAINWPGGNVACSDIRQAYLRIHSPSDGVTAQVTYPRITSMYGADLTTDPYDYAIVFRERQVTTGNPVGVEENIYSYARQGNVTPTGLNHINYRTGGRNTILCRNEEPVVAMWRDPINSVSTDPHIICDWTYANRSGTPCAQHGSGTPGMNGYEILSQRLTSDGVVYPSATTNLILQVNKDVQGIQRAPSVAGGHGSFSYANANSNSTTPNILHIWYNSH